MKCEFATCMTLWKPDAAAWRHLVEPSDCSVGRRNFPEWTITSIESIPKSRTSLCGSMNTAQLFGFAGLCLADSVTWKLLKRHDPLIYQSLRVRCGRSTVLTAQEVITLVLGDESMYPTHKFMGTESLRCRCLSVSAQDYDKVATLVDREEAEIEWQNLNQMYTATGILTQCCRELCLSWTSLGALMHYTRVNPNHVIRVSYGWDPAMVEVLGVQRESLCRFFMKGYDALVMSEFLHVMRLYSGAGAGIGISERSVNAQNTAFVIECSAMTA